MISSSLRTCLRSAGLPFVLFLSFLFLVSVPIGCSDDPSAPSTELESETVPISGLEFEDVVFEGEPAELSVSGTYPGGTGTVRTLEIRVLRFPTEQPGRIHIRAVARMGADPHPAGEPFRISADLPQLPPGEYDLEISGIPHGYTGAIHVFPRRGWIRYRAYGDPERANEGLLIHVDGRATAYRQAQGRAVHLALTREQTDRIRALFRETGFEDFEDAYLSDPPRRVRRVDIALYEPGGRKQVRAEVDLMPESLARLAGTLSRVVDLVLDQSSDRPPIIGRIEVDPPGAPVGTERILRLTLLNRSGRPATLRFPTSQLHDFFLVGDHGPGWLDVDPPGPHDGPDVDSHPDPDPDPLPPHCPPEVVWDGRNNHDELVDTGRYRVRGCVPADVPVPIESAHLDVWQAPQPTGWAAVVDIDPVSAPPGTPRSITLTVTHTGHDSIAVEYGSTQRYDFGVDDPMIVGPLGLWIWSYNRDFAAVMETEIWVPGETQSYTEVWDGKTMEGDVVGAGFYIVSGWTAGRPSVMSPSTGFLVTRE